MRTVIAVFMMLWVATQAQTAERVTTELITPQIRSGSAADLELLVAPTELRVRNPLVPEREGTAQTYVYPLTPPQPVGWVERQRNPSFLTHRSRIAIARAVIGSHRPQSNGALAFAAAANDANGSLNPRCNSAVTDQVLNQMARMLVVDGILDRRWS